MPTTGFRTMPTEFISYAHGLSIHSRNAHWGGAFPWRHDGKTVRLAAAPYVGRSQVKTDAAGNVVYMAKTI
jgi:hypothetical protein